MESRATTECIDRTLAAYVAAAFWTSSDELEGATADDLAPEALEAMREDVVSFLEACWGDTWEDFSLDLSALEPEQIGHDLWLTRNRHGAGFWDRGLGDLGDKLTELAHGFGESELYLGDDGLVYVS